MTTLSSVLFLLGKLAGALLLPPLNLLIVGAAGLWRLTRRPVFGRRMIGASLLGVWLLSTPLVAYRLLATVEAPCLAKPAGLADAIVILGGGINRESAEYGGGATVNVWTLERLRYGAKLHRETGKPILVTGGAPEGRQAEAPLMRDILTQEFRVPVTWVENRARTTRENARNSAQILKASGIREIYLVSQAWHVSRAIPEFEREGLSVIPAGTGCEPIHSFELSDLVPSPQALVLSCHTFHEWIGTLWYGVIAMLGA
jgi:uncharacterized SAM-binding protein YcdF (DUF218 family)